MYDECGCCGGNLSLSGCADGSGHHILDVVSMKEQVKTQEAEVEQSPLSAARDVLVKLAMLLVFLVVITSPMHPFVLYVVTGSFEYGVMSAFVYLLSINFYDFEE